MMTTPTFLSTFDGNLLAQTRDSVVTLTSSGPVRFVPGPSGAYVAEEGTTNYCRNPLFFNDASLWFNNGHNANLLPSSASEAWGWDAGRFFRLSLSGALGPGSTVQMHTTDTGTFLPGDPATVTAVVRTSRAVGEARVEIIARDDLTTISEVLGPYIPLVEGEQTLTITAPSLPDGTTRVRAGVRFSSGGVISAPVTFDILSVQVEKKAYPTSLCPQFDYESNLLPGYSWTGAEHASASTRAESSLTVPYTDPFGEFAVRYSEDWGETWDVAFLTEPGEVGSYGLIDLSDDILTIGASERAVLYDSVMGFAEELTEDERTVLANKTNWTWNVFDPGTPRAILTTGPRPITMLTPH